MTTMLWLQMNATHAYHFKYTIISKANKRVNRFLALNIGIKISFVFILVINCAKVHQTGCVKK